MSDEYQFTSGQYPYPLNKVLTAGGDFCKPFIEGDPSEIVPDVDNWYVICCTPDQMNKIQSSLEVGAPIAFADFYNDVIQLVDQAVQFPNSFGGAPCVDLCQLIIDCINSTPELQQLISDFSLAAPIPLDQPASSEILAKSLISDNSSCDNDRLFGAVTGIVDLINNLAEDFIEILQDQQNTIGRITELIEVIPGIGEIIPADLATLVENFVEDMINLYQAAYTQVLRDQFRCDLFCLAIDDCNVNFEEIMQYFSDQLSVALPIDEYTDFIGLYITGDFTGTTLVAAWHLFVVGTVAYGSSVLNVSADQMVRMISAMFNDPDSDWMTVCDECGVCVQYDFSIDTQGWTQVTALPSAVPRGLYITDVGWNGNPATIPGQAGCQLDFTGTLDTVTITLDSDITGDQQWIVLVDGVNEGSVNLPGSTQTFNLSGISVADEVMVFAIDNSLAAGLPGANLPSFNIVSVELCGTGIPEAGA